MNLLPREIGEMVVSLLLLLLTCGLLALPSAEAENCSESSCHHCHLNMSLLTFRCNETDLSFIPNDLPANISVIEIRRSPISIMHASNLSIYTHLTNLSIHESNVSLIIPPAFRNLSKLITLNLASNHITKVDNRTFLGLSSLRHLNINDNALTNIPMTVFGVRYLPHLRSLSLANCSLSDIHSMAFYRLNNLLVLNVSHNNLDSLIFLSVQIRNITILDVSHNRLQSMDDEPFLELVNLRFLYLHHNELSNLTRVDFNILSSLHVLDISHNYITYLHPGVFVELVHLKHLIIGANRLRTLQRQAFAGIPNNCSIMAVPNPLSCDCSIHWVTQESYKAVHPNDFRSLQCNSPIVLKNRTVALLDSEVFKECSWKGNGSNTGLFLLISFLCLVTVVIILIIIRKNRRKSQKLDYCRMDGMQDVPRMMNRNSE